MGNRKGVTLIELLIAIALLAVISAIGLLILNPATFMAKRRDAVRISDINVMQAAINAYIIEENHPPCPEQVYSSIYCDGYYESPGSYTCTTQEMKNPDGVGWIENGTSEGSCLMSRYISELRIDPVNNDTYMYRYKANAGKFELDIKFEADSNKGKMKTDGGNDDNWYEVGTDKSLI